MDSKAIYKIVSTELSINSKCMFLNENNKTTSHNNKFHIVD